MRTVNPRRRFVSIPFHSLGVTGAVATYKFDVDSVIHTLESQVQLCLGAPDIPPPPAPVPVGRVTVAGGFDFTGLNPAGSVTGYTHVHRLSTCMDLLELPGAFSEPIWRSTDMGQMLILSGTIFTIVVQETVGSPLLSAEGTFTIAFNPLSEWINFREPTVAVRI